MGRVVRQMREDCPTPISKYELLSQLAATNSTLLYYVLIHNLVECAPIVYTPTVGEACIKFDRIYRCRLTLVPALTNVNIVVFVMVVVSVVVFQYVNDFMIVFNSVGSIGLATPPGT